MPLYVASDLGLHCVPVALLRVSRKEWVKFYFLFLCRNICIPELSCPGHKEGDFGETDHRSEEIRVQGIRLCR